jgi:transmembrane sensor
VYDDPVDPDLPLIARYIAGQATEVEETALRAWLAGHPSRVVLLNALREARETAARDSERDYDGRALTSAVWRRIAHHDRHAPGVAAEDRKSVASVLARSRRWVASDTPTSARTWRMVGLAAAVLTVAIGGLTFWSQYPRPAQEYRSAAGRRRTIDLTDGTRLTLGPASRLRVSREFGGRTRTVELDGEALFTVVPDGRRPFMVRTAHALVRDVGTTFVVQAYRGDPDERVTVVEGEVALGGASLRARDIATINTAGAVTIRRGADLSGALGWTQGQLVFDRTPLSEAARQLGRMYDLDVRIADSALSQMLVKGTFTDESADDVLGAVTLAVGARYERAGRKVVIRRASVPASQPGPSSRAPLTTVDATPRP